MINAFDIFENATDCDKELFMSALDNYMTVLPELHDHVATRVKEREKVMELKEKFKAGVYGFSFDQLYFFASIFSLYINAADTHANLDHNADEKLWTTAKKYSRLIEGILDDNRK